MGNTFIIISREYKEHVQKKSFIITTLLMPLLMLAVSVAPAAIMALTEPEGKSFNVIDESGIIAPQLSSVDDLSFNVIDVPVEVALADRSVDGLVYIPADIAETSGGLKIYSYQSLELGVETSITSGVNKAIERERLKKYNIENLDSIIESVKSNVKAVTVKLDDEGGESQSSALVSYVLGFLLAFILYIALMLYGQMVMNSIIEEKNNRVLELVVSSVKPFQLMLGKIAGIALVAVTQIAVWVILLTLASAFLMPAIVPADIMAQANAMEAGAADQAQLGVDAELLQLISMLADPLYVFKVFGSLLMFLVAGFLFYAGIYAAVGSAVDNAQDASQLQTLVIVPVVLGIIFGMQAVNAPYSTVAVVASMVPFTSSMVMLARIPFGVPWWQIALSFALLLLGIIFMIWLAGKIFRVGIFMYGKKPTIKELIRWARYK